MGISSRRAAKAYRIVPKFEWKGAGPRKGPLHIPTSDFMTLRLHLCRALALASTASHGDQTSE